MTVEQPTWEEAEAALAVAVTGGRTITVSAMRRALTAFASSRAQSAKPEAQRQAEPVAIVAVTPNGGATVGWMAGHIAKHNDLLFAAPPPAQAPLTEGQVNGLRELSNLENICENGIHDGWATEFARAIEQAHGIR